MDPLRSSSTMIVYQLDRKTFKRLIESLNPDYVINSVSQNGRRKFKPSTSVFRIGKDPFTTQPSARFYGTKLFYIYRDLKEEKNLRKILDSIQ